MMQELQPNSSMRTSFLDLGFLLRLWVIKGYISLTRSHWIPACKIHGHPQTFCSLSSTNQRESWEHKQDTMHGSNQNCKWFKDRDWETKLPSVLWAYRTSYKTVVGTTPFDLTYGLNAILPIEFLVPRLRVAKELEWTGHELSSRVDELERN